MKDQNETKRHLRRIRNSMDVIHNLHFTMVGILGAGSTPQRAERFRELQEIVGEMSEAALEMALPIRDLAAMGCMDDEDDEWEGLAVPIPEGVAAQDEDEDAS